MLSRVKYVCAIPPKFIPGFCDCSKPCYSIMPLLKYSSRTFFIFLEGILASRFSLEKKRSLWGHLKTAFQYLKESYKKDGERFFSSGPDVTVQKETILK